MLPLPAAPLGRDPLDPCRLATAALPLVPETSPRLARAVGEGPVRRATLELWSRVLEAPERAEPTLSQGLRAYPRLGAGDRRVVGTLLHGFLRHARVLDLLVAEAGVEPTDPVARYLVAMILLAGLEPALARQARPDLNVGTSEFLRERVAERARGLGPAEALALGGSLPGFVARAWIALLGSEASALIAAFAERPPLCVRANAARIERDALMTRLREDGIEARPGRHAPDAVIVQGHPNLLATRPFREGLLEIQDEGSQLIVELAAPEAGERVLDLCAGAGGKSLAMAARGARVLALDTRSDALVWLGRRARRAALCIASERIGPGTRVPAPEGAFDLVVVDAPCSGSGVLGRHPGNRFRLSEARITALAAEQGSLLARASRFVAPGGRLVYATCSLLPEENHGVVGAFLEAHPRWRPRALLHERLADPRGDEAGLLLPHRSGTDGFFGVVLGGA